MGLISVHVGAGFHKSEEKYSKCLIGATQAGTQALNNGGSALDSVASAIEFLENDGITNCGRGSALNLDCEVQCDASLMQSSDLQWAGIGAVSKIKNPILAAKCLLLSQQRRHPDDLINPCFLVGEGARRWALDQGCLESDDLVTDQAIDLFEKNRFQITKLKEMTIQMTIKEQFSKSSKKRKSSDEILFIQSSQDQPIHLADHGYSEKRILDTVGAVAVDDLGNVASAVSSGGIMFKDVGRVGQASVYGAGCFAEKDVGVTTTGVGEYLIKTLFAKKCTSKLLKATRQMSNQFDSFRFDTVIKTAFMDHMLDSQYIKSADHDKLVGVLGLVAKTEEKKVQLIWAHNTPSMFIAYGTETTEPTVVFSRISDLPPANSSRQDRQVKAKSLFIKYG